MSAANLPNGRKVYLDSNGKPLAGAAVTFYLPGTSTLSTVYLDETLSTPASNPVILDSSGTCALFATGSFREVVTDADGNLISDALVVGGIGGDGGVFGTHLRIKPGDQTLVVSPVGNFPNTQCTIDFEAVTQNAPAREFMAHLGMRSRVGSDGPAGNDKVCLYTGIVGEPGTADIWSQNPLLTMEANSGSYNAQCIEADFNNFNKNLGNNGNLQLDFSAPIANGISVTGAGAFTSTTGLFVNSTSANNNPQWARGITIAGTNAICGLQMWQSAPVGIQFDGQYSIAAINLTSSYGNAGAIGPTAMFMRAGHSLTWQSPDALHVISDTLDTAGNRYVGLSSDPNNKPGIILCGTTIPQVDGTDLGAGTNRWGTFHTERIRLPNLGVITWQTNPDFPSGGALVVDYVDVNNNRVIGTNAAVCYIGSHAVPQSPSLFDLGSASNPWRDVIASGTVSPSDPALKVGATSLSGALDVVGKIDPISFKWKDGRDDRLHYGFDANEVRDAAPAAYREIDGHKFVGKDDLLAVAWQAIRELQAEIKSLKANG